MSFLNVMLLGGVLAFLAPLLIHLLNRSRFQSVDWGAMHLLESALQVNTRRVQWANWLLLFLRCLIPIVLAISLARPVLTNMQVSGANGSKSIVMMLDNSLSMATTQVAAQEIDQGSAADSAIGREQADAPDSVVAKDSIDLRSAMDEAIAHAEKLIAEFRSAEFGLFTFGGRPENALKGTTFDPARLHAQLAKLQANSGPVDVSEALSAGLKQLAEMQNPSQQLVLFSDFQASQWAGLDEAQCTAIRNQLQSGDADVQLTLVRSATAGSSRENLAVIADSSSQSIALAGEPFQTKAVIHNLGTRDASNVRVVFSADGQELSSRVVNVPAAARETLAFVCEFSELGWHHTSVSIGDSSGIPGDDRAAHVVRVVEPAELMIVEPQADPARQHGSGTLQLALAPFQNSSGGRDAFHLRIDDGQGLTAAALDGVDVLFLVDVPRLPAESVSAITRYVRAGGGLVVFPGPQMDVNWYNRTLFEEVGLLPIAFDERLQAEAEHPQKFAEQLIQVPELEIFNGGEAGELADIDITEWFEFDTPVESTTRPEDASSPSAAALLPLARGGSFLAKRSFGQGIVLQCCTACSAEWSNLPLRPAYVPLMQRMATMAMGRQPEIANLWTGEQLTLTAVPSASVTLAPRLSASSSKRSSDLVSGTALAAGDFLTTKEPADGALPLTSAGNLPEKQIGRSSDAQDKIDQRRGAACNVFGPSGPSVRVELVLQHVAASTTGGFDRRSAIFSNTNAPGLYRIENAAQQPSMDFTPGLFAVNCPVAESDLRTLSDLELEQLADRLGATLVTSASELAALDRQRSNGQELWRWMLVLLVAFLFGEILLGQKITRGGG